MSQGASTFRSLSVVIPAYNAGALLGATLDDVSGWLAASGLDHEIIVVDDGSGDATAGVARRHPARPRVLVNGVNRGKGFAVRRGMLEATGDWVLFMDADNSTRIAHLDRFAPAAEGADILIGSRRLAESRIVKPQPRLRQFLGRTFPYLVRLIATAEFRDTQCGFKLFRRDAAREVFSRTKVDRFAFDVEALLIARALGYRVAEVAVDWENPGGSTLRVSADTVRMLWDVIDATARVRWLDRIDPAPSHSA